MNRLLLFGKNHPVDDHAGHQAQTKGDQQPGSNQFDSMHRTFALKADSSLKFKIISGISVNHVISGTNGFLMGIPGVSPPEPEVYLLGQLVLNEQIIPNTNAVVGGERESQPDVPLVHVLAVVIVIGVEY